MLHTKNRKVYYHDFEVYTDPDYSLHDQREACLYEDMVSIIFTLFCYACSTHKSVQFIRLDTKLPKNYFLFNHMQNFGRWVRDFIKYCSRLERGVVKPYFLWCREKNGEDIQNPHFHLFLLLCDRKEESYTFILEKSQSILQCKFKGHPGATINFCTKDAYGNPQQNGIFIKKPGQVINSEFRHCFHWATYLAKKRTKESFPAHTRRYNKSELPGDAYFENWLEWYHGETDSKHGQIIDPFGWPIT